jgi:3-oxoacyl-[acyl-carrier protein] reductase
MVADGASRRQDGTSMEEPMTSADLRPAVAVSRRLEGSVAVVTGGAKSIGAAITLRLAAEGAAVAVNYRSSAQEADSTVAAVRDAGGTAVAVQADLRDRTALGRLFDAAAELGPVDIVVANAGVPSRSPFVDVTEEDFDRVFAVNARSVFFVMQEAARRIRDGGRIINISSSQTVHPAPAFSVYGGSKAAAKTFVDVLAQELGPRGITVNSVVAGPIDAGFLKEADDAYKDGMAQAAALRRLGTPEDIADVVAFLASPDSRYMTGQHLVADGGATHF